MTGGSTTTVRVELPAHLRQLARIEREATVTVSLSPGGEPVTLRSVLDALEAAYPMLEGTIRDHSTRVRRPFIRFFAGQEDLSHQCSGEPLPACILSGQEPLIVLGAIAGGEQAPALLGKNICAEKTTQMRISPSLTTMTLKKEHDSDTGKGAVEQEAPQPGKDNPYIHGQLGHRDQDQELKDNDTDFPEPETHGEHSGEHK